MKTYDTVANTSPPEDIFRSADCNMHSEKHRHSLCNVPRSNRLDGRRQSDYVDEGHRRSSAYAGILSGAPLSRRGRSSVDLARYNFISPNSDFLPSVCITGQRKPEAMRATGTSTHFLTGEAPFCDDCDLQCPRTLNEGVKENACANAATPRAPSATWLYNPHESLKPGKSTCSTPALSTVCATSVGDSRPMTTSVSSGEGVSGDANLEPIHLLRLHLLRQQRQMDTSASPSTPETHPRDWNQPHASAHQAYTGRDVGSRRRIASLANVYTGSSRTSRDRSHRMNWKWLYPYSGSLPKVAGRSTPSREYHRRSLHAPQKPHPFRAPLSVERERRAGEVFAKAFFDEMAKHNFTQEQLSHLLSVSAEDGSDSPGRAAPGRRSGVGRATAGMGIVAHRGTSPNRHARDTVLFRSVGIQTEAVS